MSRILLIRKLLFRVKKCKVAWLGGPNPLVRFVLDYEPKIW